MPAPSPTAPRGVSPKLGALAVAALGLNCVVGSGVFLLPGPVAARLAVPGATGPRVLAVTVAAGILAYLIALCFARVASRFDETGGAYVYARAAFGPLVGFQVGWVSALAGTVAWGALVRAFATALGRLWPDAATPVGQTTAVVGLVAVLLVANLLGVRRAGAVSTVVGAIKLTTLVVFVGVGIWFVDPETFVALDGTPADGTGAPVGFAAAVLLMLYAYVGFENLVVPAGEMERPTHTLPRAIVGVLATVTVLYVGVMVVVFGTLPAVAGRNNAVADAAEAFLGPTAGSLTALAVVVSILGVNAASSLVLPRRYLALAERGDLPARLARLSPRTGAPTVAIVGSHLLTGAVALSGSFAEIAALAVVGRLLQYIPTCLAVLMLDRHRRGIEGRGVPVVAFVLSVALLTQATPFQLGLGALAMGAGLAVYLLRPGRQSEGADDDEKSPPPGGSGLI